MGENMKTIVITGATSGIGNLLVKEFAHNGAKVFAGYRNENLKAELSAIGENVVPFYIDMSKKETIVEAARFVVQSTDKIDTLVNAAGCVYAGAMECLSVDKIRAQFEVNTFSHLEFTQGLFSKLHGAKVINISSMASFGIFPFVAPYCASKRALDILFNSMQVECGPEIKVISIKPGVIKTPLWNKSIEGNLEALGDSTKYLKEFEFLKKNAQKNSEKGLDPQKVADFIVKVEALKNPKASYTIGFDAKAAEIVSHLPQGLINYIVKFNLERRLNKV
jgi:short-subunit dehydrogenase